MVQTGRRVYEGGGETASVAGRPSLGASVAGERAALRRGTDV
jgi:hypothetical protein